MKTKNVIIGSAVGGALLAGAAATYLKARRTIPEGAEAVKPFKAKKYLGKWYEIARMDFHFEKKLDNVAAEYSLNKNGTIKVVNSGYNYRKGKKEEAEGVAKFVKSPKEARLKVSFFGPFYSGYNVIEIDKNYKYALVAGRNLNYLWFLSREPMMPEEIKEAYLKKAEEIGYDTSRLIWSEHKN